MDTMLENNVETGEIIERPLTQAETIERAKLAELDAVGTATGYTTDKLKEALNT